MTFRSITLFVSIETFSLVSSWRLRNKVKLACDFKSLSRNVIMQVLFSAAVIVLVHCPALASNRAFL